MKASLLFVVSIVLIAIVASATLNRAIFSVSTEEQLPQQPQVKHPTINDEEVRRYSTKEMEAVLPPMLEPEKHIASPSPRKIIKTQYKPKRQNETKSAKPIKPHTPKRLPVVHYTFDGHGRDEWNDTIAEIAGPRLVPGRIGKAYEFFKDHHYIKIPASKIHFPESSISLWFYLNEFPKKSSKLISHIRGIPKADRAKNKIRSTVERIEIHVTGKKLHVAMGINRLTIKNCATIELKRWYHIALTWKNNNCTLYVNGNVKCNGEFRYLTKPGLLLIGNLSKTRHRVTKGIIDDIKIWNRQISEEEVLSLQLP